MQESDKQIELLKEDIRMVIRRNVDLSKIKAFFFGSRVTGKARPRSDFDVGLLGPEPVADGVLRKIRQDMDDLRTLYKIDVIDFFRANPEFREVALEKIEEIR